MSLFLSAFTVLLGAATAGKLHTNGVSNTASVSQIRSTLENLLRSIEDNGRDAEALFGKRQFWCDSTIQDFSTASQASGSSLGEMRSQLTETLAALQEAKGTVEQVRVDIDMVQHTIKQTSDMLGPADANNGTQVQKNINAGSLRQLVDNKRLSLASLQGQLQVAVPTLAQLQARVAETRERISYRTESLTATRDFIAALKDSCQKGADRADREAAAHVGEAKLIHAALSALGGEASPAAPEEKEDDSLDDQMRQMSADPALSFVQRTAESQEVTMDDLSTLFATGKRDASSMTHAQRRLVRNVPAMRPRIHTILLELQHIEGAVDQTSFCSTQRESSKMAMKFAQDSLSQINSEVAAHVEAEAELADELRRVQSLSSKVTESAKSAFDQASKENAFIQRSQKDEELATRILDQASTILKELGSSNATKAVADLMSVRKMLTKQLQTAVDFQAEAAATSKAISEAALSLTNAQESEQHNLEFARDDHESQRLRSAENKQLYEADAEEATVYVKKLEESCKTDTEKEAAQQRSVQVHALEDADKALSGKLVEAKNNANSLRGAEPKPATAFENMTPMQRAAAEMGVSTD